MCRGNKIFVFCILTVSLISCKKTIRVDLPDDFATSEAVFNNDKNAIAAVTGIYSEMMGANATQFSASGITIFTAMCADELTHTSNSALTNEFVNNQLTIENHNLLSTYFWAPAYKYIYTANACIEGLDKSTKVSPSLKKELTGECYFIRAFCYFHLVNLFGNVPLALTTDYRVTSTLPRSPKDAIYDQMISDLRNAKDALADNYNNTNGQGRTRPNKWAAAALLARVYLYKGDWVKAEQESTSVIGSGVYSLPDDPTKAFLSNSSEAIWQLFPVRHGQSPASTSTINTWEGNHLVPSTSPTAKFYALTSSITQSFENGDERKDWLGSKTVSAVLYNYPAKYKVRTSSVLTEYYMVLRLAEQYLIRAEARANLDNKPGAREDIDTVRHRSALAGTSAITKEEILLAIENERKIELFAEWGHRWYDLKRTNRANAILGVLKPTTWQPSAALWPIPSEEMQLNPGWQQNPGY